MRRTLLNPKIDFVFKKIFGSEEHPEILISFLNAVLKPKKPIVSVEIKNSDLEKEYIEDKDILEKQKLVEVINLIENINNDDLNLDEKWDKLKLYLELIKKQGREIGTQLLEIIVLMAK